MNKFSSNYIQHLFHGLGLHIVMDSDEKSRTRKYYFSECGDP